MVAPTMQRFRTKTCGVMVLLLGFLCEPAGAEISCEVFLGSAANLKTPLRFHQAGEPEIELRARYGTRAFQLPLYYGLRLGVCQGTAGWELQFLHHKLHLDNRPAEVQHFEVTHGFNLLTLHYLSKHLPVDLRLGAGVVIAHTESTVRRQSYEGRGGWLGGGYETTGPALLVGAGHRFLLGAGFHLAAEAQLSVAWARVQIARGEARLSNVAFHALLGVGVGF